MLSVVVVTGGFDRRRRTPFFYAAPRNWHSQRGSEEDDNDQDIEDEGKQSPSPGANFLKVL